jgi:signal transduction histidine kinase
MQGLPECVVSLFSEEPPAFFSDELNSVSLLIDLYKESGDTTHIKRAFEIAATKGNKTEEGECYRQMGLFLNENDDNDKSIQYFLQALDAFAQAGDTIGMMKANLNLGVVHYHLTELELALSYLEKSAFYARKINDQVALSIILGNLGSIYERQEEGFERALACHTESMEISEMLGDTIGLLYSNNNLGVLYEKNALFDKAFICYENALHYAQLMGDEPETCRIFSNLASLNIRLGKYQEAYKSLKASEQNCLNNDIMLNAYRLSLLSDALAGLGRFSEALKIKNQYILLNDSLFDIERMAAINELSTRYETEKKEQQIQLLEKDLIIQKETARRELERRRMLFFAMIAVILFTLIMVKMYLDKVKLNKRLAILNSHLQESESQLRTLNHSKDKFFGIISHDLRNPLSAFEKLSLKMASQQVDDQRSTAKQLAEHSKMLINLLNNLLLWSKVEQGLLLMKPQALLPQQLVEETFSVFFTQADEKGLKLFNNVDPDLMVFADRQSLLTILRNLISNAVKFTLSGEITVSSENNENIVSIKIADTGCGMEKQQLERMFTLASKHKSGLGLLLCKELAERNNARISIESAIGKGTIVTLFLPKFEIHEDSHS